MKAALLITLILLAPSPAAPRRGAARPAPGAIEGVVRDLNGAPIPEATVYAINWADMRRRVETSADQGGRFALRGLPPGTFGVHAYKESAGYPDSFFSFFATNKSAWQEVKVEDGRTSGGVVIELGPVYATLNISVEDERGAPVDNVVLIFTRVDDPGRPYTVGSNSSRTMLVPPVPFRLQAEAEGYPGRRYATGKNVSRTNVIHPSPGETISVVARLRRPR